MTPTLTDIDKGSIELAAEYADVEVISYSGRAMYGEKCLGVVAKGNGFGGYGEFLLRLAEDSTDLAWALAHPHPKCDNMGLDTVVYWPQIPWVESDEDDEDDEDD